MASATCAASLPTPVTVPDVMDERKRVGGGDLRQHSGGGVRTRLVARGKHDLDVGGQDLRPGQVVLRVVRHPLDRSDRAATREAAKAVCLTGSWRGMAVRFSDHTPSAEVGNST